MTLNADFRCALAAIACATGILIGPAGGPDRAFGQVPGEGLDQPGEQNDASRFFGNDERVTVKPIALPWQAIGKVVHASTGFCSGTLIAPDIVITAAHCMFDGEKESDEDFTWDAPVHFIAGFHDGRFAAVSHVADVWLPPEFDMRGFLNTYDHDHQDFALLRLEEPIGEQTGWFRLADLTGEDFRETLLGPDGPKISQAGYSQDSNRRMTGHIGCRLVRFEPNDTVLHECDTMEGDSGSPLFYQQDGDYWLIAVESQWLYLESQIINGAVDTRAFSDAVTRFAAAP